MQEEVENRTVNLAITTTKLTSRQLIRILNKVYHDMMSQQERSPKGRQSVKKLLQQNQGATASEVDQRGIREFEQLARKYGIVYAVRKNKSVDPPRYTVFVRAKDGEALGALCNEYQARVMNRKEKPSVLAQLSKFKNLVASLPKKIREKKQERDL